MWGPALTGTRDFESFVDVFVGVVLPEAIAVRRDREQLQAHAVEQDLHLVRLVQPLDVFVSVPRQLDLNLVFAIEREEMFERGAAARPERQAVDVILLRQVRRNQHDAADRGA